MRTSILQIPESTDSLLLRTMLIGPAESLTQGKIVAFPTETVYGLGANALDPHAVEKVFIAKSRPANNPLIVHIANMDQVETVAQPLTPLALELAKAFWPGPLTLVVPAHPDLPQEVTGGLDTVALRMPSNLIARTLIALAGVPIVGPSANISGRPSPTLAAHVLHDLRISPDWVIDGGACEIGIESTVVDARGTVPVILREGKISREDLSSWTENVGSDKDAPKIDFSRSPGTMHPHYRPRAKVIVAQSGEVWETAREWNKRVTKVGMVASAELFMNLPYNNEISVIGTFNNTDMLAANLYGWLREADEQQLDTIVIEAVSSSGLGRAVMDRLQRASM